MAGSQCGLTRYSLSLWERVRVRASQKNAWPSPRPSPRGRGRTRFRCLTFGDRWTTTAGRWPAPFANLIRLGAAHFGAHVAERGACDAAERLDRDEADQDDHG